MFFVIELNRNRRQIITFSRASASGEGRKNHPPQQQQKPYKNNQHVGRDVLKITSFVQFFQVFEEPSQYIHSNRGLDQYVNTDVIFQMWGYGEELQVVPGLSSCIRAISATEYTEVF